MQLLIHKQSLHFNSFLFSFTALYNPISGFIKLFVLLLFLNLKLNRNERGTNSKYAC